jgi:hypothetical protein
MQNESAWELGKKALDNEEACLIHISHLLLFPFQFFRRPKFGNPQISPKEGQTERSEKNPEQKLQNKHEKGH